MEENSNSLSSSIAFGSENTFDTSSVDPNASIKTSGKYSQIPSDTVGLSNEPDYTGMSMSEIFESRQPQIQQDLQKKISAIEEDSQFYKPVTKNDVYKFNTSTNPITRALFGDYTSRYNKYLPGADNETLNAQDQGGWSVAANAFGGMLFNAGEAFSGYIAANGRAIDAAKNGDFSKMWDTEFTENQAKDLATASDYFAIYKDAANSEGLSSYIPFLAGSGEKWGHLAQSFGFTIGTLGGVAAENALFAYTTGGVGNLLRGSKTLKGVFDAVRMLSFADKGADALKGLSMAQKLAANGLRYGKNANVALNAAFSEGSMEAAMASLESMNESIAKYKELYGVEPDEAEIQRIKEQREKVGNTTFSLNAPILLASNFAMFGNYMRTGKFFSQPISELSTRAVADGVRAELKKGIATNAWRVSKKIAGVVPEGLEEVSQSIASESAKRHYDLYSSDTGKSFLDTMTVTTGDLSKSGRLAEDFLSGAIIGGISMGIGAINDKFRGKQDNVEDRLNQYNTTISENIQKAIEGIGSRRMPDAVFGVAGTQTANKLQAGMEGMNAMAGQIVASQNKDKKEFYDYANDSTKAIAYANWSNGMSQIGKEIVNANIDAVPANEYAAQYMTGQPTDEQIATHKEKKKTEFAALQDQFDADMDIVEERYGNPINKTTNPNEWQSWEEVKRDIVFYKQDYRDAMSRSASLNESISKGINTFYDETGIKIEEKDIDILVSQSAREKEISSIEEEEKALKMQLSALDGTIHTEQQKDIREKLAKLEDRKTSIQKLSVITMASEMMDKNDNDLKKSYQLGVNEWLRKVTGKEFGAENPLMQDISDLLVLESEGKFLLSLHNALMSNGKLFNQYHKRYSVAARKAQKEGLAKLQEQRREETGQEKLEAKKEKQLEDSFTPEQIAEMQKALGVENLYEVEKETIQKAIDRLYVEEDSVNSDLISNLEDLRDNAFVAPKEIVNAENEAETQAKLDAAKKEQEAIEKAIEKEKQKQGELKALEEQQPTSTTQSEIEAKKAEIERRRQEDLEYANFGNRQKEIQEGRENTKKIFDNLKQKYPANTLTGQVLRLLEKLIDINRISTISEKNHQSARGGKANGSAFEGGIILDSEIFDRVLNGEERAVKTFIHELFHQILNTSQFEAHKRGENTDLSSSQIKAWENLERLYEKAKNISNAKSEYGFTNLSEFLAEAFSNQGFQKELSDIKGEGKDTTLFKEILNSLLDFFKESLSKWAKRFNKPIPEINSGLLQDVMYWSEQLLDINKPYTPDLTTKEINAKYDAELKALEESKDIALQNEQKSQANDVENLTSEEFADSVGVDGDAKDIAKRWSIEYGKSPSGNIVYNGEIKGLELDPSNFKRSEFEGQENSVKRIGAENIDLSEPIKATIFSDGTIQVQDGHHRLIAAQELGKKLKVDLTFKNTKPESVSSNIELVKAVEQSLKEQSVENVIAKPTSLKEVNIGDEITYEGEKYFVTSKNKEGNLNLQLIGGKMIAKDITLEEIENWVKKESKSSQKVSQYGNILSPSEMKIVRKLLSRAFPNVIEMTDDEVFKAMNGLKLPIGMMLNGKMWVNSERETLETRMHELGGHVFFLAMKNQYPSLYERLMGQLTDSIQNKSDKALNEVVKFVKELYPELAENSSQFNEEVMATYMGQIMRDGVAKAIKSKGIKSDIAYWLNYIYERLMNLLGIENYLSMDKFANNTLGENLVHIGKGILNGRVRSDISTDELGAIMSASPTYMKGITNELEELKKSIDILPVIEKRGVKEKIVVRENKSIEDWGKEPESNFTFLSLYNMGVKVDEIMVSAKDYDKDNHIVKTLADLSGDKPDSRDIVQVFYSNGLGNILSEQELNTLNQLGIKAFDSSVSESYGRGRIFFYRTSQSDVPIREVLKDVANLSFPNKRGIHKLSKDGKEIMSTSDLAQKANKEALLKVKSGDEIAVSMDFDNEWNQGLLERVMKGEKLGVKDYETVVLTYKNQDGEILSYMRALNGAFDNDKKEKNNEAKNRIETLRKYANETLEATVRDKKLITARMQSLQRELNLPSTTEERKVSIQKLIDEAYEKSSPKDFLPLDLFSIPAIGTQAIYNENLDEWMPISEFLEKRKALGDEDFQLAFFKKNKNGEWKYFDKNDNELDIYVDGFERKQAVYLVSPNYQRRAYFNVKEDMWQYSDFEEFQSLDPSIVSTRLNPETPYLDVRLKVDLGISPQINRTTSSLEETALNENNEISQEQEDKGNDVEKNRQIIDDVKTSSDDVMTDAPQSKVELTQQDEEFIYDMIPLYYGLEPNSDMYRAQGIMVEEMNDGLLSKGLKLTEAVGDMPKEYFSRVLEDYKRLKTGQINLKSFIFNIVKQKKSMDNQILIEGDGLIAPKAPEGAKIIRIDEVNVNRLALLFDAQNIYIQHKNTNFWYEFPKKNFSIPIEKQVKNAIRQVMMANGEKASNFDAFYQEYTRNNIDLSVEPQQAINLVRVATSPYSVYKFSKSENIANDIRC